MSLTEVFLVGSLLALTSGWLTGWWIAWARKARWLDAPGKRRSHQQPTVTAGGWVLIALWILASLVIGLWVEPELLQFWPLWMLALFLSLVGWLDDHRGLPILPRLLAQLLTVLCLLFWLWPGFLPDQPWFWRVMLGGVLLLAMVWYINAFNFMDGIDGIAGQQAWISFACMAWLAGAEGRMDLFWTVWLLLAVVSGFLPRNWSPASLFMGDAGSLPLGMLSVALGFLFWQQGIMRWPAVVLLLSLFNLDAFFTLVKRWFSNRQCYTPHREHLYQWLVRSGFSHGKISSGYALVNLLMVIPLTLWVNRLEEKNGVMVLLSVSLILAGIWWWLRQQLLKNKRYRS